MAPPSALTLEIEPRSRFDVIDVRSRVAARFNEFFRKYRNTVYSSHHTTAGYLEQSFCARLNHDRDSVQGFVASYEQLFPPGADYQHDRLHLRSELSEEQRRREPKNGHSHLTFIGSGLKNCVTYSNDTEEPVYLIELDGIHEDAVRRRWTTVIGYNHEEVVHRFRAEVPISHHAIDSVNLKDPRYGLYDELRRVLEKYEVRKGRIDVSLAHAERHAALTVNEYETLLMKHDFAEVLRNPLYFIAEKSRNMFLDPRSVPAKALNYAKYDFVQVLNEVMDKLGATNSGLERAVDRLLALPAARALRMKRSVSLVVDDGAGAAAILEGTYQSPILMQWRHAQSRTRVLDITLTRFE